MWKLGPTCTSYHRHAHHAAACLQAALAKLVLKRFLLLVALLDRAVAQPSLPSGVPLLFRPDSKLKSSAQVLAGGAWRAAVLGSLADRLQCRLARLPASALHVCQPVLCMALPMPVHACRFL